MKIEIIYGDITSLDNSVKAIVNAANETLLGGGGVDGAIHAKAGRELLNECRKLNGCLPGEAKVTKAYNLKNQQYIIHTVGPRYYNDPNPKETLRNAYLNSLKIADNLKLDKIAFPSISTGAFGYPFDEAAEIAISTIKEFKSEYLKEVLIVIFNTNKELYDAYKNAYLQ